MLLSSEYQVRQKPPVIPFTIRKKKIKFGFNYACLEQKSADSKKALVLLLFTKIIIKNRNGKLPFNTSVKICTNFIKTLIHFQTILSENM